MSCRPSNSAPSQPTSVASAFGANSTEGGSTLTFDDLNPVEQAVASLGVQPQELKSIQWLNNAHHDQLRQNNALETDLARRIEAFKHVAGVET